MRRRVCTFIESGIDGEIDGDIASDIGRKIDGALFESYGCKPCVNYRLRMRVVSMGDTNATDVANEDGVAQHRALLSLGSCGCGGYVHRAGRLWNP